MADEKYSRGEKQTPAPGPVVVAGISRKDFYVALLAAADRVGGIDLPLAEIVHRASVLADLLIKKLDGVL